MYSLPVTDIGFNGQNIVTYSTLFRKISVKSEFTSVKSEFSDLTDFQHNIAPLPPLSLLNRGFTVQYSTVFRGYNFCFLAKIAVFQHV